MINKGKKECRFGIRVDEETLYKYRKVVGNASEDMREYMKRRAEQTSSLSELQLIRLDKIKQRDTLNIEIEELDKEIKEAKELREENNQNSELIAYCMESVENLISNNPNKVISRDRVEYIAERKELEPSILIKACKEKGIKFVSEIKESLNSKLVEPEKTEEAPNDRLMKKIWNDFWKQKNKGFNRILEFVTENEEKYIDIADDYGADYDTVKEMITERYSKDK